LYTPDYQVFINRKRFVKYVSKIKKKTTLLLPSFFGKSFVEKHYEGEYTFFDMELASKLSSAPIQKDTHKPVNLNVGIAGILLACQMGASDIFAVGMDGYEKKDKNQIVYFYNENDVPEEKEVAATRYELLAKELNRANNFLIKKTVPFAIITPTSHKKYFRNVLKV
jgi:hypothetical protein